jgi:hypothetical protein
LGPVASSEQLANPNATGKAKSRRAVDFALDTINDEFIGNLLPRQ